MAYEPVTQHGNAEYRAWIQVPSAVYAAIQQGDEGLSYDLRNYALMVYNTNPNNLILSADTIIMDLHTVEQLLSGMYGFQQPYADYIIDNSGSDGNIYVCKGQVGSATSAAVWQIKRINTAGTITQTTWADGNTNFDNIAISATILTYI